MNTELIIVFLLFILILFILFAIELTKVKKSYSQISKKHDQISIPLYNVFDFTNIIGLFSTCVGFEEIKWFCAFTKDTTQKFIMKPQSKSMNLVHLIVHTKSLI